MSVVSMTPPAFEEPDAKMYRESPSPIPSSSNSLPGSVSAIPAAVLLLVHKEIVLLGCPLLVLNDAGAYILCGKRLIYFFEMD